MHLQENKQPFYKRQRTKLISTAVLILVIGGWSWAQQAAISGSPATAATIKGENMNDKAVNELTELNRQMGEAEKNHDVEFFKKHLHNDLRFRRASRAIVSKKEFLWDLIQPENTFEELTVSDVEVTAHENTAVVSLLVHVRFKRPNEEGVLDEKKGTYRNTRIFIKEGNDWQCAFWFNTDVSDLPKP